MSIVLKKYDNWFLIYYQYKSVKIYIYLFPYEWINYMDYMIIPMLNTNF